MQYLNAFEQKDLSIAFRKYFVEEFVQRNLRRAGFNYVGDILALDETDFQVFLSGENHTVQKRSLALYKALQGEKSRIIQRHSSRDLGKSSPVGTSPSSDTFQEIISDVRAETASESDSRELQSGLQADATGATQFEKQENTTPDPGRV